MFPTRSAGPSTAVHVPTPAAPPAAASVPACHAMSCHLSCSSTQQQLHQRPAMPWPAAGVSAPSAEVGPTAQYTCCRRAASATPAGPGAGTGTLRPAPASGGGAMPGGGCCSSSPCAPLQFDAACCRSSWAVSLAVRCICNRHAPPGAASAPPGGQRDAPGALAAVPVAAVRPSSSSETL